MVAGVIGIIANPPRTELHDENAPLAIMLLVGVILSALLMYGISYVIEAACLYLEKNKEESNKNQ